MPLKRVTSTKFLGVIIDEKLDWSLHINELCQVLRKNTGILYKLSQFIPQKILKILYFSLIHSKLLYGILLYANTFPTYLHDLIILNNRILRIIQNKSRRDHTEDLYKTFHTLPIDLLFKSQLYSHAHCLFYKSPLLPPVFHSTTLFNSQIHNHDTRSKDDFHRSSISNTKAARLSVNLCASLWNTLPNVIKNTSSLPQFKILIKEFLWQERT